MKTKGLQIKTLRDNDTIPNYKENPMVADKQRHFDFADVAVIGSVFPESKGGRPTHSHAFFLGSDEHCHREEHFPRT